MNKREKEGRRTRDSVEEEESGRQEISSDIVTRDRGSNKVTWTYLLGY